MLELHFEKGNEALPEHTIAEVAAVGIDPIFKDLGVDVCLLHYRRRLLHFLAEGEFRPSLPDVLAVGLSG
jgi:hypothetical protein